MRGWTTPDIKTVTPCIIRSTLEVLSTGARVRILESKISMKGIDEAKSLLDI